MFVVLPRPIKQVGSGDRLRLEAPATSQNAPCDARQLVSERDRQHIVVRRLLAASIQGLSHSRRAGRDVAHPRSGNMSADTAGDLDQQAFSRGRYYLRFRVIDVVDLMRHRRLPRISGHATPAVARLNALLTKRCEASGTATMLMPAPHQGAGQGRWSISHLDRFPGIQGRDGGIHVPA